MKLLKALAVIILLAATAISSLWVNNTFFSSEETRVDSMAPTLEKIQNLSELVTNKVYVSDVLDASNKDYEGKWIISGDALITIDLNDAGLEMVNDKEKTATIILPQPKVTSPRVDYTKTKPAYIRGIRFALLRNPKTKQAMMENMMSVAQKSIEKLAGRPEIIENSKNQAALIISNLYLKVGWQLTIEWKDEVTLKQ